MERVARKTPLTPSRRARTRKPKPRKTPGERYDARAYGHSVAHACDRALPHPSLSLIARKKPTAEQRAELKSWRKAQRWHTHQLRRNAATNLRREYGLDVARIVLGHASAAITELYAEADSSKAMAEMGEVGWSATPYPSRINIISLHDENSPSNILTSIPNTGQ